MKVSSDLTDKKFARLDISGSISWTRKLESN